MTAPTRLSAFPDAPAADASEFLGRAGIAAGVTALIWGCASLYIPPGTFSIPVGAAMALRLTAYLLCIVTALLIQGSRGKTWHYGLLSLACAWVLVGVPVDSYDGPGLEAPAITGRYESALERYSPRGGWEVAVWTASILGCASLGTFLARWLTSPKALLAVVLCVAAGDVWLSLVRIQELVPDGHPARLLKMPWPPPCYLASNNLQNIGPALTDLVFVTLCMEIQRKFRLSGPSMAMGALITYSAASLATAKFWQIQLTAPLVGLGVLMGVWPELRCTAKDVLKSVAVAILFFGMLILLRPLHRVMHPDPKPKPIYYRLNNAT